MRILIYDLYTRSTVSHKDLLIQSVTSYATAKEWKDSDSRHTYRTRLEEYVSDKAKEAREKRLDEARGRNIKIANKKHKKNAAFV